MCFAIFPCHLSKILRLPKSDASSYEVLHHAKSSHQTYSKKNKKQKTQCIATFHDFSKFFARLDRLSCASLFIDFFSSGSFSSLTALATIVVLYLSISRKFDF